jgi:hypothetical protein
MKTRIIAIIIAVLCANAGIALISDFNGMYQKVPSIRDPWCGKSIEIQKIRFNKYRISWDLITGERSVAELYGKVNGDMIDCRNKKDSELYGYTYALTDNKNKLIVTLKVPKKTIVCEFTRVEK